MRISLELKYARAHTLTAPAPFALPTFYVLQVRCCKQYQLMEQERLEHQRNALWVCMNIGSAVAVEVDKVNHAACWRRFKP